MTYKTIILTTIEQHIAEITLNRPKNLNTFNHDLAHELNSVLLELEQNSDIRVIIIKGAGKHFCAGIDLHDFNGKSTNEYKAWIEKMEAPFLTMSKISKPVIASVHGVAAANGAGIVAASDLAICSSKSKIGLTAINVGLNCIGPVVPVSRSIGRKKALEMLYFGDLIPAQEAERIGLINKVVEPEALEEETRKWASKLAKKNPVALQNAKTSFYNAIELDYEKSFNYMNEAFARLCSTEEAIADVNAFINKNKSRK
jgi:enoyl-CoA hydratase/carnithine racemase